MISIFLYSMMIYCDGTFYVPLIRHFFSQKRVQWCFFPPLFSPPAQKNQQQLTTTTSPVPSACSLPPATHCDPLNSSMKRPSVTITSMHAHEPPLWLPQVNERCEKNAAFFLKGDVVD